MKVNLLNILSGYFSNTQLNANFDAVETAIENTLSRDGTSPNQMLSNFDMNSYRIINLPTPASQNDAARLKDVQDAATVSQDWMSTQIHSSPNKTTPVDADEFGIWDSVGGVLNKVTFANLKTVLNSSLSFVTKTSTTGSAVLPTGTTAQRDVSPITGYTRYNTTLSRPEAYNGTTWLGMGGATGAGGDDIFYENGMTVTTDYTLTTNKNAMSAGPITINTGITVTVPTGATWTVV